jgi:hypothetical protein
MVTIYPLLIVKYSPEAEPGELEQCLAEEEA